MTTNPQQLALQYKDALNATGAFVVQPNGTVKMAANRGGGYVPPWVWAGAIPPASGNDAQSQALRIKLSTPASDPSSPWHDMYSEGGPFTKHSAWDSQTGTYDGGIDWGTLLGTAAVGGLFAAPAIAGAVGGSAATGAAGSGAAASAGAGSGAAAGGAGVASTTAAGAGWFSPSTLIPSVVGGVASIYGANQQANASEGAAKLQFQSTEEALKDARDQRAYEQQQYANYLGRLQPYLSLGTTAGSTLQNVLARNPYTRMANDGPVPQYSTMARTPMPSVPQGNAGPTGATPPPAAQANAVPAFTGGSGTIKMRAPDGSVRDIPMDQQDHFKKLGAIAV